MQRLLHNIRIDRAIIGVIVVALVTITAMTLFARSALGRATAEVEIFEKDHGGSGP